MELAEQQPRSNKKKIIILICALLLFIAVAIVITYLTVNYFQKQKLKQLPYRQLRFLSLCMEMYAEEQVYFPTHAYYDDNGNPLHSWRVEVSPYLGRTIFYRFFKKNGAWDTERNLYEAKRWMPDYFKISGNPGSEPNHTYYQVFVGKDTLFPPPAKAGMKPIQMTSKDLEAADGKSYTIMVATANKSVFWTKPEDMQYSDDKPLPKLGGQFSDGYHVLFADGSVRFVRYDASERILRAAIKRNDGVQFSLDELE